MLQRFCKISLICLLFVPCLFTQRLLAQIKFTATISPASIGKDETAELRLMIENAQQVQQITPPDLNDFYVVGGPTHESRMETFNGFTRKFVGISYLLRPKAIGKFIIPPTTAVADGKTFQSNPVTLEVTKKSSGNNLNNPFTSPFGPFSGLNEPDVETLPTDYILKKGENVQEKISKNIFIKVDADKSSCYVGEPVVVTYKLYTRLKSESNIIKNPSFNGFSVIDLVQPGNEFNSIEKLNGKEYKVFILRKSQLYPLQPGELELEPAELDNTVHFIKEEYARKEVDYFGDIFRDLTRPAIPAEGIEDHQVTLKSNPVTITVKALPETNKPASFKGAVGRFYITAAAEKNNFSTDDAGKLTITLTGEGNMTLINAPEIKWPDGIEGYEVKTSENIN